MRNVVVARFNKTQIMDSSVRLACAAEAKVTPTPVTCVSNNKQ